MGKESLKIEVGVRSCWEGIYEEKDVFVFWGSGGIKGKAKNESKWIKLRLFRMGFGFCGGF